MFINADYLNLMSETLTGDIQIAYTGENEPVLFKGQNARLVISPLRRGC